MLLCKYSILLSKNVYTINTHTFSTTKFWFKYLQIINFNQGCWTRNRNIGLTSTRTIDWILMNWAMRLLDNLNFGFILLCSDQYIPINLMRNNFHCLEYRTLISIDQNAILLNWSSLKSTSQTQILCFVKQNFYWTSLSRLSILRHKDSVSLDALCILIESYPSDI